MGASAVCSLSRPVASLCRATALTANGLLVSRASCGVRMVDDARGGPGALWVPSDWRVRHPVLSSEAP